MGHRRLVFIAAHGLENERGADLTCFDPLHRGNVSRVVVPHEADLHAHSRPGNVPKCRVSILQIQRQRLFAQNILPSGRGRANRLGMKFVRRGDQHGVDVCPLHHFLEAGVGVFDFQFFSNLFGALRGDVGDGNQPRLWHQTPQVLSVPFAHFPDAEHPTSSFHIVFLLCKS
jgi:hypothetical protein